MACGGKVVGVKREPTSRDYISGMLDGYFIFISICFVIFYGLKVRMLIENVCSYYSYIMLLVFLLCFCIESPFLKILQEPKIVDFWESDDKEEVNGE